MKNYIPLLIGLVCASAYAADTNMMTAKVKYYNSMNDVYDPYSNNSSGYITVTITPTTTIYDVQHVIRDRLGLGHMRHGSVRVGELPNYRITPMTLREMKQFKDELESIYSFWAFDLPLNDYEMMQIGNRQVPN